MAPADNALLVPAAAHGDDAKDVAHVISSSTTASSPAKEQQEAVPAAAMLLGRGITEPCAPVVKVKNTFIDGFDDEDDDDELPMCAAKSLPAFRTPFSLRSPTGAAPPMTLNPVHEGLDASETSRVMYWQPDPAGARPADASRAELLEQTLHPQQHEQPQPQEPQQQQPQQQQQQQQPQQQQQQQQQQQEQVYKDHQQQQQQRGPASVAVTAFEARKPEWSLGSDVHGTGECRPCAWFWRPQGCTNGGDCRHCHLCPAGEVKARRKNKLASLRKATRETAAEE